MKKVTIPGPLVKWVTVIGKLNYQIEEFRTPDRNLYPGSRWEIDILLPRGKQGLMSDKFLEAIDEHTRVPMRSYSSRPTKGGSLITVILG